MSKKWLVDHNEPPVQGNKIVLGVTLPAVSYQPVEFGASQVITASSNRLNRWAGNYIATVISKLMYQFSYGKKPGLQIYKNMEIELPIDEEENINWKYMTDYVKRIEAYLTVLGYPDVNSVRLTEADRGVLNVHSTSEFAKFKVGDLFNFIKRGKRIKSADRVRGDLPFITAGVSDTGLSEYIGNHEAERFPANSLTIDMFGTIYYRGYVFGADDHIAVLHSDDSQLSKHVLQYIQPNIEKAIAGQFSYSKNFYAKDAYDIEIKLPVKDSGPNFNLMEKYISVLEKKNVLKIKEDLSQRLGVYKQII